MGKKKGKKDPEKKAALAARKEAKHEKSAQKRLLKDAGGGSSLYDDDDDDDGAAEQQLDSLLLQYQAADKVGTLTTIETLKTSFPLPRANATLTLYEDTKKKNAEIYLFGGEYFDGVENIFLNHLLKYDLSKKGSSATMNESAWKQIHCPQPLPPPRCAHSCVYYNHSLWVFGGEMSRSGGDQAQFHHYKDVWRYDMKELKWEEIKPSKAVGTHPTSRSGHVAVVWKHFMVIFGGFFEANKETPRWYNEVFVMNLQTHQWLDIPYSKLSIRPEPRSACNAAVVGDDVVIHGGFSKLSKSTLQRQKADELEVISETKVHTDAWVLHLKPLLSEKPPTWERLTSSVQRSALSASRSPNGRAAMASVVYKNRLLAFGGVVDTEALHHKLHSVFYNDMFALDVERRKWFPMIVKTRNNTNDNNAGSSSKRRSRQSTAVKDAKSNNNVDNNRNDDHDDSEEELDDDELDETSALESAWNIDKLRSNMFAFMDGNGNMVYEKMGADSDNEDLEQMQSRTKSEQKIRDSSDEEEEEKEDDSDDEKDRSGNGNPPSESPDILSSAAHQGMGNSSVMKINPKTKQPEAVTRAEPLPRINASMVVSGNTLFLYGGLLEVGDREITLDDMWTLDLRKRQAWECLWPGTMHKQVWRGAVNDDDESYSTDNRTDSKTGYDKDGEEDDEDDEDEKLEPLRSSKSKEAPDDGLSKKDRLKSQLSALRDEHGLADEDSTPAPGEGLTEFYARTSDYWNKQTGLTKETGVSSKEIKRQGFSLAKDRFDSLQEVLEKFSALELEYRKEKKAKKDKKKEK